MTHVHPGNRSPVCHKAWYPGTGGTGTPKLAARSWNLPCLLPFDVHAAFKVWMPSRTAASGPSSNWVSPVCFPRREGCLLSWVSSWTVLLPYQSRY